MIPCPCCLSPDLTALSLTAWHRAPGRAQCQERGMEPSPVAVTQPRLLPSITPANTPLSRGLWMLLGCPSPEHQQHPPPGHPGAAPAVPSLSPWRQRNNAGVDEGKQGCRLKDFDKVLPKMSGERFLSLSGDSGQRMPASHIPHPASLIPHPSFLHPTCRIPHLSPCIPHPASRISHPASFTLHPVSRAVSLQQEALPPRQSIAQPRASHPRLP